MNSEQVFFRSMRLFLQSSDQSMKIRLFYLNRSTLLLSTHTLHSKHMKKTTCKITWKINRSKNANNSFRVYYGTLHLESYSLLTISFYLFAFSIRFISFSLSTSTHVSYAYKYWWLQKTSSSTKETAIHYMLVWIYLRWCIEHNQHMDCGRQEKWFFPQCSNK